ncbi:MAG: hypothetical protein J2P37_25420 [Ktedonobacteraceae bacterium]|nr:hypothetical protein [Ktedonobacteraceae bacterium]
MQGTITNWGAAIMNSFAQALAFLLSFIPRLIGFLVILLIGWLIAKGLEKAVTFLLRRVGFDRLSERIGLNNLERRMNMHMDAATLLGKVVFWFVFLIALVPAIDALGLPSISALLGTIVGYIPNVFVAILVLLVGTLIAALVAEVIMRAMAGTNLGHPKVFANIARYSIIGFAALIALDQLRIAPSLINILFTAIMGGMALAFGLAFGLGGRDTAQRWLNRGEASINSAMRTTDTELRAQPASQQQTRPPTIPEQQQQSYGSTQPYGQKSPPQPTT